jgi:Plasmid stabilization system protein
MAKIVWSKRALSQLERNIRYIKEERGVTFGQIVLDKILGSVSRLTSFPLSGSIEPLLKHKKSEYRFVMAFSYKVIYRVQENKIVISRVFHTSRNPEKVKGV